MYYAAPVNGLINKHNIKFDAKGDTTLEGFVVEEKHCHTAGSLHGSCYFKLLDDAAFFASQARVRDFFVLTSAFNTVFMRPVGPGTGMYLWSLFLCR
jgi:acyl-coenzyme A thioesterase PaaI-like protein